MKKIFLSGLIVLTLILSSCATTKRKGVKLNPVYVTNTKKFYLLAPDAIEKTVDQAQFLSAKFGTVSVSLLAYTKADENGIYLSLFNDFGTGMGSLNYDGYKVSFDSAIFPKKLKAEYILADLQFAYYRYEEVSKALEQIMLELIDIEGQGFKKRVISSGDEVIEEISYQDNSVTINNFLRGYTYVITGADE